METQPTSLLAWELDWIEKNKDLYDSPLHAEAVKRNIEKRYEIIALRKQLSSLGVQNEQ